MDEPYEIGIRIALDNGVAQAAPAIARELAMLDRAVAATEGRMSALRGPMAPVVAKAALNKTGAMRAEVPEAAAAPNSAPMSAPMSAPVVVPRLAGPPVLAAPVVVGAAPMVVPALVAGAPVTASAAVVPPADPVPLMAVAPAARLPQAAPPPSATPEAGIAPAPVAAVGPADSGRTDSARFAPAAAPFVVAAAPVLAEPDGRASVVVDGRPALADAAAGQTPVAPVVAMQAAPLVTRAEAVRESVASATGQGVEPAAQPDAERVTEGRLEIDGASMGRWLTQHLAREAGRAPAGMTAVDRRMSVPWAGALQG